jgi:hypothetical protein
MSRRALILILASSLALPVALYAMGMPRKPSAAERKVVTKYATVISKVLDQFRSPEWDEKVEGAVADVQVTPDSGTPLTINEMFQRTYDLRKTSPRYKAKLAPMEVKMKAEKDQGAQQLLGAQMQDLMHVQVQVRFNIANIDLDPRPSPKLDLHVPGAAFAYKELSNPFGYGSSYVVVFGNWKTAKRYPSSGITEFHFVHPQNTPFIENVEFRIYGADDRIRELLRTVKWAQVNAALTL